MSSSQTRERANRLSRDRALEAAIGIADREGLEALTMRRLADELGAGAMSVYYHVTNKDHLLTGMVDRVVGEMEVPESGQDWRETLRRSATSAHEVLLQHPWATALLLSGTGVSDNRLRYMDAMLACLRGAGFSVEQTDLAYHALDSHIMGSTLWLVNITAGMKRLGDVGRAFELFDADELPHLAEHARQHMLDRGHRGQSAFEFGLELILEGLERRLVPTLS